MRCPHFRLIDNWIFFLNPEIAFLNPELASVAQCEDRAI